MSLAAPPPELAVGIGWRHPHNDSLLQTRPSLDFIEVHSENFFATGSAARARLLQARRDYAVSLHGVGLSLGSVQGLDDWHLEQLAALVTQIEPVRVSDHASFARGRWRGAVHHAADLLPLPFCQEALAVLCDNVQQVQDRLQRQLVVENISAYLRWQPDPQQADLTEPEFLTQLARRSGCALLIDVNNLYVNACNEALHGRPGDALAHCQRWLDAMDPADVAEIHLAGHCRVAHAQSPGGEIVIDDHGSRVCPAVWQLYRHALGRFGAVPSLIEWDTDLPALTVLLDEAALARSHGQAALATRSPA